MKRVMKPVWGAVALVAVALVASVVSSAPVLAQGTGQEKAAPVPLKVTVTIARFEGEKKTGSLPFVLWVNAGGGNQASIQMGSEVPIPTTTQKDGVTTASYTYRSLGTNIQCGATAQGDGSYRVDLNVQDSQVFRSTDAAPPLSQFEAGRAVFQSFRAMHQPILRDGQTVQFAVATDKTTGEVIKLEVMLNVVK